VALTVVIAACSSGGSSTSTSGAVAAASGSASSGALNLSGVDLKIGYQTADFPALLKASGLFNNTPYKYEIPIINGPANQLAALYGNQIDVGEAGDNTGAFEAANATTPWTKATAPIQGIAVTYTPGAPYGAVTFYATKSSGIKTLADLKGKKIGYNYGGNIYAGYVLGLADAGLGPKDVDGVEFPNNQAAANAFDAGDLDAVVTTYAYVEKKLASGQAIKITDTVSLGAISGGGWLALSSDLKDPAKVAALKDFFSRLRKYYEQWVPTHEAAYEHVLETVDSQTPTIAKINWETATKTTFYNLGEPVFYQIEQKIVDAAYKFGGLKSEADAHIGYTTLFDSVTVG